MSQTPEDQLSQQAALEQEAYQMGWSAVTRLLRQGWSWSGHEKGVALRNLGPQGAAGGVRFATVSHLVGFDFDDDSRALARLDWDRDGDEDLILTSRSAPRLRLLENTGPAGRRLQVWLHDPQGQRDAIGARIELTLQRPGQDPLQWSRSRRAGEGFLSQSSGWMTFGLGDAEVMNVRVRWPDGSLEEFSGVDVPGRYRLVRGQGSGVPVEEPEWKLPQDDGKPLELPRSGSRRQLTLAKPLPLPSLPIELQGGREARLFGLQAGRQSRGAGQPMLIHLWASWCAPCRKELVETLSAKSVWEEAGLLVLALSPNDAEERAAAEKLLGEIGWDLPYGFLSEEASQRIDGLQAMIQDRDAPLPVPTSLLIDARGRMDSLFFGAVEVDRLKREVARLQAENEDGLRADSWGAEALFGPWPENLEEASTFAHHDARWHREPEGLTLEMLERTYRQRGLEDAAAEVSRATLDVQVLGRVETLIEVATARGRQANWAAARDLFREASELDQASFEAWQGLGVTEQQLGNHEAARDAYREALRLRSDSLEVRFNLALAAFELKEYGLVKHQAKQIEKLEDPRAGRLAEGLRARLQEAGQLDE